MDANFGKYGLIIILMLMVIILFKTTNFIDKSSRFELIERFNLSGNYQHGLIAKDPLTSKCYLAIWTKGNNNPDIVQKDC